MQTHAHTQVIAIKSVSKRKSFIAIDSIIRIYGGDFYVSILIHSFFGVYFFYCKSPKYTKSRRNSTVKTKKREREWNGLRRLYAFVRFVKQTGRSFLAFILWGLKIFWPILIHSFSYIHGYYAIKTTATQKNGKDLELDVRVKVRVSQCERDRKWCICEIPSKTRLIGSWHIVCTSAYAINAKWEQNSNTARFHSYNSEWREAKRNHISFFVLFSCVCVFIVVAQPSGDKTNAKKGTLYFTLANITFKAY